MRPDETERRLAEARWMPWGAMRDPEARLATMELLMRIHRDAGHRITTRRKP